jgi:hypothetical protein
MSQSRGSLFLTTDLLCWNCVGASKGTVLVLRRCFNTALNALPSKTGDAEVTVAGFKALSFHLLGKLRRAGIRIMCLYHCASLCGAQCEPTARRTDSWDGV